MLKSGISNMSMEEMIGISILAPGLFLLKNLNIGGINIIFSSVGIHKVLFKGG